MTAQRLLALLALVLLATLPFAARGGLRGEFIEDDLGIIRDNPELCEGGSLWSVWGDPYWRDVRGGLYRPLTVFSYGVDRIVYGAEVLDGPPRPFGIHATNVILNAASSLLVYFALARRFGGRAAWLGAALFAVHPTHVEAVVHMVGRADVLAALWFLAAWYAHGPPGEGRARGWWLGGLFYLLSLLSKESGAALPALLFCETLLLGPRRPFGALLREQAVALAPYAVALVPFLLVRGLVLGAELDPPKAWVLYTPGAYVAFQDPAPLEIQLTMAHAIVEYLDLLVAPLRLSADYSGFPHHVALDARSAWKVLVLGALLLAAGLAWRRGRREPLVWASFFFWTLLPASNLIVVSGIVMAERVLYLPSVALSGLVAASVATWWRSRAVTVVVLAVIALFTVRTVQRVPVWRDPRTLFEETVANGRHRGHLALTGLCDVYIREMQEQKKVDRADLTRTIELARESVDFHRTTLNVSQLAWLLEQDGKLVESLQHWAAVEAADPARRADVERVIGRLTARAPNLEELRAAERVALEARDRAGSARNAPREAFWTNVLQRLFLAMEY